MHSWAHRHGLVKAGRPIVFLITGERIVSEGTIVFNGAPFDLTLDDWGQLSSCCLGREPDRILSFILVRNNRPFTAADIGGVNSLKVLKETLKDFRVPYEVVKVGKRGILNTYRIARAYRPA